MVSRMTSVALLAMLSTGLWLLPQHDSIPFVKDAFDDVVQLPRPTSFFAPFTCGTDPQGAISRVLPGQYASAVNVANAGHRPTTVRVRVALTFPNRSGTGAIEPGPVSPTTEVLLQPGEAFEVDCGEVPSQFFPGQPLPPYVQGFVVVSGPPDLVVHVVSTAGQIDAAGEVQVVALDIEEIEGR